MKNGKGIWKVWVALGIFITGALVWAQQPVAQGPQASNAAEWLFNLTKVAGSSVATGHGTAAGSLRVELPTDGTGVVGAAESGTWIVQPGNTPNTSPWLITAFPSTASGAAYSRYHASSAAAANIKASAGNLYGLALGNSGTVPCWLQLMNTAGTPTAGTSVLDSYYVQAGVTVVVHPGPIALANFGTGIGAAGATTDSGATTTGCTTTFSVTAYYQ